MSERNKATEDVLVCENCGKLRRSHREVNGELLCYPDTFPDAPLIFRFSEWQHRTK
jgi:hypothetical protein